MFLLLNVWRSAPLSLPCYLKTSLHLAGRTQGTKHLLLLCSRYPNGHIHRAHYDEFVEIKICLHFRQRSPSFRNKFENCFLNDNRR